MLKRNLNKNTKRICLTLFYLFLTEMNSIIDGEVLDFDNFVRSGVDNLIQIDDGDDDLAIPDKVLEDTKLKYGIHFIEEEPRIIVSKDGNYIGSSMTIYFPGTGGVNESIPSFYGFIARFDRENHFCLVPGCTFPNIKVTENK